MDDTLPIPTDVAVAEEAAPVDPMNLPLPEEGLNTFGQWKSRIQGAVTNIDNRQPQWDKNQKLYLLEPTGKLSAKHVVVPDAFTYVEQKKAIFLAAVSERVAVEAQADGLDDAANVFEHVINYFLGDTENKCVDFPAAIDEVLSDLLCASGLAAVKIGYQPTIDGEVPEPTGQMIPDPKWVPDPVAVAAAAQGLAPMPQAPLIPETVMVPNIISEQYFFERVSPSCVLIPDEFKGSKFDRANWLGHRFEMDLEVARRVLTLPEDFQGSGSKMLGINADDQNKGLARKVVTGVELYYKAHVYDPTVKNPELQRCLVIVDGLDKPVKHTDSKYQKTLPDGRIMGMQGFPLHVMTLRYVSDKAYVPSDIENIAGSVEEKSRHRTAQIVARERMIPQTLVDTTAIGGDPGLAKLEKGVEYGFIPVGDGGDLNQPITKPVEYARYPQENFQFENYQNQDIQGAMGMAQNQTGAINTGNRSAQEVATAASGSDTRQNKEINKLKRWAEKGIEKLASLLQMFADKKTTIRVKGVGGQPQSVTWDKHDIAGPFSFKISIDPVADRNEWLQMYNFLAASPNVNRLQLDTELVQKYGLEPAKYIQQPQPPAPPKPELPKGFSFDKDSFNPTNPAFSINVAIARLYGIAIPDDAVLLSQQAAKLLQENGGVVAGASPADPQQPNPMPSTGVQGQPQGDGQGSAERVTPINKHATEITGDLTGPKATLSGR